MAREWDSSTAPAINMTTPNEENEEIIVVDSNLRTIKVPSSLQNIGVVGDHVAEAIFFQVPRYFDGQDLSEHSCLIRYINAGRQYSEYPVTDIAVDDDFIVLAWQITNYVTRYSGTVQFTIQFETVDSTGIAYQWQTVPAQLFVSAGLPIESTITDKDDSLFRTLSNQVANLQATVNSINTKIISKTELKNLEQRVQYLEDNVVYTLTNI